MISMLKNFWNVKTYSILWPTAASNNQEAEVTNIHRLFKPKDDIIEILDKYMITFLKDHPEFFLQEMLIDPTMRKIATEGRDKNQLTLLHYVIKFLARTAHKPNQAELFQSYKKVFNQLIANKADINAQDKRGITPLMFAARHLLLDIMQCLLDGGADANLKTDRGSTAYSMMQDYKEANGRRDAILNCLEPKTHHNTLTLT